MRHVAPPLILLAAALPAVAADPAGEPPAAEAPVSAQPLSGDAVLWRSARVWEARHRGDLARQVLEKLARAQPNNRRVTLEIGLVELRSARFDEAKKTLERLRKEAPGSAETRELETAYRVMTRDRVQLAAIGRLLELDRRDEAEPALQKLFPDGPPGHTLGIDYYRIVARLPNGWARARAGFEQLIADNPDDPRYRLALAEHLTLNSETRARGLDMFPELATRDDVRRDEVMTGWRRGLGRASSAQVSAAMLRRYAELAPDDPEAQAWAQAGRLPAAQQGSEQADAPVDPAAARRERQLRQTLADARQKEEARDPQAALDAYRRATAIAPRSADALLGEVRALAALQRFDEAEARVTNWGRRAPREAWPTINRARADIFSARSAALLDKGENGDALRALEAAQALVPADPWTRLDLARLYARLGAPQEGRSLMEEGLDFASRQDVDARYAQALYLASLDADADALAALAAIPPAKRSPGVLALQARLEQRQGLTQARALHQAGDHRAAVARLQSLPPSNDPQRVAALAEAWADIGEFDAALRTLDAAHTADDPELRLPLMRLYVLELAQRDTELLALADALQPRASGVDTRKELQRRRVGALRRLAAAQQQSNDRRSALKRIDAALAQAPDDRALRELRADLLLDDGQPRAAAALYTALLAEDDKNPDLRLSLARALEQLGRRGEARAQIEHVLATVASDDVERRVAAARRLRAENDRARAAAVLAPLVAAHPGNAALREEAGWLARSDQRYEDALREFRAAQSQRRDDAGLDDAIAAIEARRRGFVSSGVDISDKSGDAGLSDTQLITLPVELRWARGYDGHFFAHADSVRIDAGRLPADYDVAAQYGTVQANGPLSLANFPDGSRQRQSGVALGIGYESDQWRIDLGTTPIGFEVEDVVGGLRFSTELGPLDVQFDASRRPVTSSLVAYAGAKDPVSGRVWGGVRRDGGSARLARYGERFSASLTTELAWYEGRNVPDNRYYGGRVGTDYKLYAGTTQTVYAGLAASYWNYQHNQRYYSFGHGGYYSPQSYVTVSLPLEWRGRYGPLSYQLRAALSHSNSKEDDALFYPHDAALQAEADSSPLPSGYADPLYEGGKGNGWGRSLQARVEYQLAGPLVIGARAGLDRSDYYEPNFFSLYFRWMLDDGEPLEIPPRPPQLYADF